MGSDAVFRMGHSHEICQDYALAGGGSEAPYVIVSDGCSGAAPPGGARTAPPPGGSGAPYTDLGARLVVHAFKDQLDLAGPSLRLGEGACMDTLTYARRAADVVRIPRTALDATLIAVAQRGSSVSVVQCGDGVVAWRDRASGRISYTTLKFGGNMPFYPSYLLSAQATERYLRENNRLTVTRGERRFGVEWTEEVTEETLTELSCCRTSSIHGADLILAMSDGAESFQDKDGNPVPLTDVLEQLFAVKNTEGRFLARRAKAFLERFCREKGWRHEDDFSVGGIYIPAEPVSEPEPAPTSEPTPEPAS